MKAQYPQQTLDAPEGSTSSQPAEAVLECPSGTYIVNGVVRPGGTALLFTPTPTDVLTSLDLGELYFREVSLVPSYSCGPEDTRCCRTSITCRYRWAE